MNSQRILHPLFPTSLILCLMVQTLSAATFGKFNYTDNGSSITITGCDSSAKGAIVIPATIIGKPVTSIRDEAFIGCNEITGVTIPNSITHIGDLAFATCDALASVSIPESVRAIGVSTFDSCPSLSDINIPISVTSIGDYAFSYCTSLKQINIPNSVTSIGAGTFSYCGNLTHISIPGSVVYLGDEVFFHCENLNSVSIGNGLTSIGNQAFDTCVSLTIITLPESLKTIGSLAFNASGLSSVFIPKKVNSIQGDSFYACEQMTQINVDPLNALYSSENGVLFNKQKTAIIEYPYAKSGGYEIPDGVTKIGDDAFLGCYVLTRVRIPGTVTSIAPHAFLGCDNLTAIQVDAFNPAYSSDYGVLYDKRKTKLLQFPGGKNGSYTIPNGVISIDPLAFYFCGNLKKVIIPKTVTSIRKSAFYLCSSLEKAFFLGNAPSLGSSVFVYCANGFKVEYLKGNTGFSSPTWHGYPAVAIDPASEIDVQQPLGSSLVDGTSKRSFGTATVNVTGSTKYFTIKNTGTATLTDLAITMTGVSATDFTVTAPARTWLSPDTSTTFKVTFKPSAIGTRSATIQIKSNDADEIPFDIQLTGSGAL
jgi:hypothetical protein